MIKNYLRVAIRNLLKNKSYVLINTFGLGIALACCITAYILVAYNIEFDNFHKDEKVENIFRIHGHVILSGNNKSQVVSAPSPLGPSALKDIAGIKNMVRYAGNAGGAAAVSYINEETGVNNTFGENLVYADSTLFDMFDFPLTAGSHGAFKELNSVFMDQERATKYFGDEDPIGKVLTLGFSRGIEKKFVVRGVFDEIPVNTSIYLPFLIRFEHFIEMREMDSKLWHDWNVPVTFFELEDPSSAPNISPLFDKYLEVRNEGFKEQTVERYELVPFKQKLSRADITWSYINTPIEVEPLIIFIVLGMMILLIACFNLTNTSIALSASRLKEIGVRKSLGAYRQQIASQFMFETLIVIILSLIVGYAMSGWIVPEFVAMWELPYTLKDLEGINLIITLVILVFTACILAGIYPSLFSSKFNTVSLLKGTIKVKGTNRLTRTLVSMQFAISVIVLIGGVVFIQNSAFQDSVDFGYDKEKLMLVDIQSEQEYKAISAKAKSNPIIQSVGATEHHIGWSAYSNPVMFENVEYEVQHLEFGENYFETMDFVFTRGRPIDYDKTSDYENAIVVSEQLLKTLNIQGDPIGQFITIREQKKRIVGVIEDFVDHIYSTNNGSTEIKKPFVFYATFPERWRNIVVRADEGDLADAKDYLEEVWKQEFPTKPFNSRFQDDVVLQGSRQLNGNLKKIFLFLTILGGLLSASGIFSLASLNIAKRTKEIGIRKALGASVGNVVMLLNKEFVIILSIAGVLGSIGGYFGTTWMLDMIYAFHVNVGIIPIFLCAAGIFLIGILTTSFTIFRAAKANPVDTLRDE